MLAQLGVRFLYNDDELNKLPSKKKYASFNNRDVGCSHSYFYEYVKSGLNQEKWQRDVSEEILNALCFIYNKKEKEDFNSDDCDYLYYWLNELIYTNITYHLHYIPVIKVLEFLLKSSDGRDICKYDEYYMNIENYRDIKKLF
ncbi:variable surface protein, partial [Plasmodium gonderi]